MTERRGRGFVEGIALSAVTEDRPKVTGGESLYLVAKEQGGGSFVHKSASLLVGLERLQVHTLRVPEERLLVKGGTLVSSGSR